MGLFFSPFRKSKERKNAGMNLEGIEIEVKAGEENLFMNDLADAIVSQLFGKPLTEEEKAEMEEQKRLTREGERIRKEKMAAMGIAVDELTQIKVLTDTASILDSFVPGYRRLHMDFHKGDVFIDFCNLTRTGKIPKNVANAQYMCNTLPEENPRESLIVNLKYMADMSINMADVYVWRSDIGMGVYVRKVNGIHRITCVTRKNMSTNVEDALYSEASGAGDPSVVIESIMRESLKV